MLRAIDLQAKRQRQARWLYTRFNNLYFFGKLPRRLAVEVAPGMLGCGSWGECYFEGQQAVLIRIAEANWTRAGTKNNSFLKSTILHEMAHAALGPGVAHESQEWKDEMLRLGRLGALVETV